jgi:hypothetical protein
MRCAPEAVILHRAFGRPDLHFMDPSIAWFWPRQLAEMPIRVLLASWRPSRCPENRARIAPAFIAASSCRIPVHSSDFSGGSHRQHSRQSRPPIATFMIPMRDLCPEDREVKIIMTIGRLEVPPVFLKLLQFSFKLTDAIDTSAKRNGRRLCVQLHYRQHYPKHELLRLLSFLYAPITVTTPDKEDRLSLFRTPSSRSLSYPPATP